MMPHSAFDAKSFCCVIDDDGFLQCIVEEKVATPGQKAINVINSGIYCFEAEMLWQLLPRIDPNPVSGE